MSAPASTTVFPETAIEKDSGSLTFDQHHFSALTGVVGDHRLRAEYLFEIRGQVVRRQPDRARLVRTDHNGQS
jgi:hypothetical protein